MNSRINIYIGMVSLELVWFLYLLLILDPKLQNSLVITHSMHTCVWFPFSSVFSYYAMKEALVVWLGSLLIWIISWKDSDWIRQNVWHSMYIGMPSLFHVSFLDWLSVTWFSKLFEMWQLWYILYEIFPAAWQPEHVTSLSLDV